MTRIFNYGASLLKAGKEEDALQWAALAGPRYPDTERWQEFINAAVNNRLVKFIQQRRAAEARDFLAVNAPVLSGENYSRMDAMVLEAELSEKVRAVRNPSEADAALAAIAAAERRNLLPPERIGELRTFVIGKTASFFAEAPARDWPLAIAYLEKAIAEYGANRQWEKALEGYRSNYAAAYHNLFAEAYNKKNYDEALRILNEGLAKFPGSRQLLSDRRLYETSRR
jgi:tetratricopeptide (TPR) repeat protein